MAERFEEVTSDVTTMMETLIAETFTHLSSARILPVFDLKKRQSGGRITLGSMQKTNDLMRHLTADNLYPEGYDYIMRLDKLVWTNIGEEDKIRLMRHELSHCLVDMDSTTNQYKIQDHEVTDFYSEIEYNASDPRWGERLAAVASNLYSRDEV